MPSANKSQLQHPKNLNMHCYCCCCLIIIIKIEKKMKRTLNLLIYEVLFNFMNSSLCDHPNLNYNNAM